MIKLLNNRKTNHNHDSEPARELRLTGRFAACVRP